MLRPDMPSDLPRRRGAPLGWAFSLAFIVHGAMPGGGVIGLSLGLLPAPFSYAGALLGIVLIGLGVAMIISFAIKARARIEAFREVDAIGQWASATILDATVGMSSSKGGEDGHRKYFKHVTLRLRVEGQGANAYRHFPVYELEHAAYYSSQEVKLLQPGAIVNLKVHPHDRARVIVYPPAPPAPFVQRAVPSMAIHV